MRSWVATMALMGVVLAGCGRETTHTDPPPGGWVNGATNAQSFAGQATPQFKFDKDSGPVVPKDAVVTDSGGAEDLGGPLILDGI